MSSNMIPVKLESIILFANGRSRPEHTVNGKYPVYGSNGMIGFTDESNSPENSIIIGRVGSYCGAVHYSNTKCWVTDNAIRGVAKNNNDPSFIYYLLKYLDLNNWRSGSGQPLLNQATLNSIVVTVPAPDEQRAIGSFISLIDMRITLLRETNTTLEAIAQALFKSWFVDFDPVRAKAEGRQPEGMDAATAALFPDGFEESELGEVPRGWRVGKVEDLMELAYGKSLKSTDRLDGDVPVYGSGGVTGYHNKPLVDGPSIIVGRKGTVGSLYWEDRPFYPIDTVFYVNTSFPMTYCYYLLQTLGLEQMNTDAAVPGLNRSNAYRLSVIMPSVCVLDAFDKIAAVLRMRMASNNQQAQTLTQLRDTLLPRLISGQLRLPEAEATIEEALA